jgi:hypothetical protein
VPTHALHCAKRGDQGFPRIYTHGARPDHTQARVCAAPLQHAVMPRPLLAVFVCAFIRDMDVARRISVALASWDSSLVPQLVEAGVLRQAVIAALHLPTHITPTRVQRFCPNRPAGAVPGALPSPAPASVPLGDEESKCKAGDDKAPAPGSAPSTQEASLGDHSFRMAVAALDTVHACMTRCWDAASFVARVPGVVGLATGDDLVTAHGVYGAVWPVVLAAVLGAAEVGPGALPSRPGVAPKARAPGASPASASGGGGGATASPASTLVCMCRPSHTLFPPSLLGLFHHFPLHFFRV